MPRPSAYTEANINAIKQHLIRSGKVTVGRLSKDLNVSEVSIRKYLAALENQGVLIRTHGGAVIKEMPERVYALSQPAIIDDNPCKRSIASAAAQLIHPGARIVVDSGSTTAHLLPFLQKIEGLVVMTNSLPIANALTQNSQNATVLMSGGTWDPLSQSFQGQMSEKMIQSYNFEMAFVGASGLDLNKGTTTFHELTKLSQVMSDSAQKTIVLAQSDKLFKKMPNIELSWSKVSTLVTDNLLSDDAKHQIQQYGVQVNCTPIKEN
ncbi:MAG: Glucitol operon repressor [Glaciecola sp. HTCC2999]|jgi:DeoR/GlpR family transcriptional regulator of sugar metabolism|nr:MAG: Glucitol operon repressor [Glaciecola sp. HTCC2999]